MICGSIYAGDVQLSMGKDRDTFFIGDRIPLHYSLEIPRNTEHYVSDAREWMQDAEVLDQRISIGRKRGARVLFWKLEVTAFDTGYIHIPSMPLVLKHQTGLQDTVYTPETRIYIRTVLDTDAAPVAINPPLPLTLMRWWQYLISGLLLITAIWLLWYGIKYRTKNKAEISILLSPYEKALHALALLESEQYHMSGQWKAFYLELTRIVRSFYEDIYFIHLQELTTSELLPVMNLYLPEEEHCELASLFQFADLVKFAKGVASEEQCKSHMDIIKRRIKEKENAYNETRSMD
jgi:hypothetical protein